MKIEMPLAIFQDAGTPVLGPFYRAQTLCVFSANGIKLQTLAILDTGADITTIPDSFPNQLGLTSLGNGLCQTGAGTVSQTRYSPVDLILCGYPTPTLITLTLTSVCTHPNDYALIGRDVLHRSNCKFTCFGKEKKFKLEIY